MTWREDREDQPAFVSLSQAQVAEWFRSIESPSWRWRVRWAVRSVVTWVEWQLTGSAGRESPRWDGYPRAERRRFRSKYLRPKWWHR